MVKIPLKVLLQSGLCPSFLEIMRTFSGSFSRAEANVGSNQGQYIDILHLQYISYICPQASIFVVKMAIIISDLLQVNISATAPYFTAAFYFLLLINWALFYIKHMN